MTLTAAEKKAKQKIYMREYYETHKEERRESDKRYRDGHKEEIKRYIDAHKEEGKTRQKARHIRSLFLRMR